MELLQIQGKGSLRLTGDLVQVIGDVYETMECFNTVSSERGDVAVEAGAIGSLTYNGTDIVQGEIHYGVNADFASNDEFAVMPYVNGAPYSDDAMYVRGLGTGRPVTLFWISQVTLNPGDVVTLMAKNNTSGDISVNFQRTVFTMKIDG